MAARVLLIHQQLRFAVTLKQALERIQSFEVHPFTSLDAAVDFLREFPHDVALVDFTLPGVDPALMVTRLRVIQPGLPIVATPQQTDVMTERLELQGSLDMPFTARAVIPLLKSAVEAAARRQAGALPPLPPHIEAEAGDTTIDQPPSQFSPLRDVLRSMGDEADLFESHLEQGDTMTLPAVTPDAAAPDQPPAPLPFADTPLFERLAAEEPPPPDLEDGTLGELMTAIDDGRFRDVLAVLRGEQVELPPRPFEPGSLPQDDPSDPFSTARLVLETALDDTTPIELLTIQNLVERIQRKLPSQQPYIQPLPSWKDESSGLHEPDFLPEFDEAPDSAYQTTIAQPRPPHLPEEFVTESLVLPPELGTDPFPPRLPEETTTAPVGSLPETTAAETAASVFDITAPLDDEDAGDWGDAALPDLLRLDADDLESALFDTRFRQAADFDVPVSATGEYQAAAPLTLPDIDDPRIAQIALQLTQLSLELTAEETILTRDGAVIAYAGNLLRDDLETLSGILATLETDEDEDETHIAFVTLNNRDYVLYARGTEADLTLSLLFSRDTSVRDIRQQGSRLIEALQAVPEVVEEAAANPIAQLNEVISPEPPAEVIARAPFAYVWVTQNPAKPLSTTAAQAIMSGLSTQLSEHQWQIKQIHADGEFVYLLADVPGETPAQEVIRDLKRRAADIARSHDTALPAGALWADSYLVVTPGRPLEFDEIQHFIEFERMA